jgi:hypothetical protein
MITFQKKVVSLWRAFAQQRHQHCWKRKTLEVYWVSETAKIQSPTSRPPVSVMIGTDYCCCRGHGAWRCQDTTVMESPCF